MSLDLRPGRFHLILAPRSVIVEVMTTIIARLALVGPVRVLDGGNSLNAYGIARTLRRRTPDLETALKRIRIARAFTCYQMVTLLADTPKSGLPTLVLDLLTTFYDENEAMIERRRLLEISLSHLQRLSRMASVAVSVRPSPGQSEELLDILIEAAGKVWRFDLPTPPHKQQQLL